MAARDRSNRFFGHYMIPSLVGCSTLRTLREIPVTVQYSSFFTFIQRNLDVALCCSLRQAFSASLTAMELSEGS
jgi:hypothetical protein